MEKIKEWDGSSLFQFAEFQLASGKKSFFKLECDAITPEEWHSLARIALPILPPFDRVVGVHTGGDAWANIFQHYVQPGAHRILMVDDVWTTGNSMMNSLIRDALPLYGPRPWHGLVLFARGPVPKNITALFTLNENLQ